MSIVDHLEQHLGPIQGGCHSDELPGLQVIRFVDVPEEGLVTLATLGLSNHVLTLDDGRPVRQEFVFVTHAEQLSNRLALMLLHVCDVVQRDHRALSRGEVFDLGGTVERDCDATALYASVPIVFGKAFGCCDSTQPPTIIVWFFPIFPAEQEMIRAQGWGAFEDTLEAGEYDLFDLYRDPIWPRSTHTAGSADDDREKRRTGLVRVRFVLDLEESHGLATEGLWAEPVAGNRYRLRNVPFYAFGVSEGDIVFAEERDGQLFFREVSIRAGHSTYRLYVTNPAEFERYWSPLAEIGCTYEKGTMVAVDVPPSTDIYEAYALFEAGEEAGVWAFEEGHCGHPLRDPPTSEGS